MGPKGEPEYYTKPRRDGGGSTTYMVGLGVTYGLSRDGSWGFAIRAATAQKNLSDAAFALGERRGGDVWYPWPHGVALVLLENPTWARYAKKYPGVEMSNPAAEIRKKWPEYFEGTVKAPPPKLRAGDTIRAEEALGKGVGPGTVMEVTRVTPSMIWTDNGFRIPQVLYSEGKLVKVSSQLVAGSASKVAARYLDADHVELPSAHGIGDPVWVTLQGYRLAGYVRAITHTNAKVRYAVSCPIVIPNRDGDMNTTLHNLDSVLVTARPTGIQMEWLEADNYS